MGRRWPILKPILGLNIRVMERRNPKKRGEKMEKYPLGGLNEGRL